MTADSTLADSTLADSSIQPATPFISGVSNSFQRIVTAAVAVSEIAQLFTDVFPQPSISNNFIVPDLAGNGDLGYGIANSGGGLRNTPSLIRVGTNTTPDMDITSGNISIGYNSVESMVNKSLSMDWQTKNADPGNTNIVEAYKLSGRDYTKDGRTGEYSWATAYVNWVLNKAGVPYLETMSPRGYEKYGAPVNFRTMKEVRKNDIFIFRSNEGISHIGFVQMYDLNTQTLDIVGGNQSGTVKSTKMPFSVSDPRFYVVHVRRNWTIPATANNPLWENNIDNNVTGAPLPPVDVSYIDSPDVLIVTGDIDTDTIISNNIRAIDRARISPTTLQSTIQENMRTFAPEAIVGEIASAYQSDILKSVNSNNYPMAGEPLNQQDISILSGPRRTSNK